MHEILFIAAHRPQRSPSQRFRFEQYFHLLESSGWNVRFSYLLNATDDRYIYQPGHYFRKLWIFVKAIFRRLKDLRAARKADIVFVQREAFMTGSTFFEKHFAKRSKLVFDFDDSIWLHDVNPNQGLLNKLKDAGKTARIIEMSNLVIAGNPYLADYARQYNAQVIIIPTTIDTDEYPLLKMDNIPETVCIGWSGSFSTIKHFQTVTAALEKLKQQFGAKIRFKVIGDGNYSHEGLGIKGIPWKKETEVQDLSEIHIGIMPLPDDEWSKGKCGLKGLQYMALGIPTVMSPVGVNTDIIEEGKNGLLAASHQAWIEKLSLLIQSSELRQKIGLEGRRTVEKHYSVKANGQRYLEAFHSLLSRKDLND